MATGREEAWSWLNPEQRTLAEGHSKLIDQLIQQIAQLDERIEKQAGEHSTASLLPDDPRGFGLNRGLKMTGEIAPHLRVFLARPSGLLRRAGPADSPVGCPPGTARSRRGTTTQSATCFTRQPGITSGRRRTVPSADSTVIRRRSWANTPPPRQRLRSCVGSTTPATTRLHYFHSVSAR